MAGLGDVAVSRHDRFTRAHQTRSANGKDRYLTLPCGIDLSSNDYLGLSTHPVIVQTAHDYLNETGTLGAAGSRLLRGHTPAHDALEHTARRFFSAPAALYFSSGFQANYAAITTLATRQDILIYDAFVHASMRDGIAASHARAMRVAHNDQDAFEAALKEAAKTRRQGGMVWVLVESLYSMDGDCAPLDTLFDLAERYDAFLIVDEAHATGVMGPKGRGLAYERAAAQAYDRTLTLHTCGKALGVAGALLCGSQPVIAHVINTARPFIYSTAPMPVQAACVEAALGVIASEDGDTRRAALADHVHTVSHVLGQASTHIVPLPIGDAHTAVRVASRLQAQGFDIRAIRPPTVPEGTARLRLSLSAPLSAQDLNAFLKIYTIHI